MTVPVSKLHFTYYSILPRSPVSIEWKPTRKLELISLPEVTAEIAPGEDVKGLRLAVVGPGLKISEEFDMEDEAGFITLKSLIRREVLRNLENSEGHLMYSITIAVMSPAS